LIAFEQAERISDPDERIRLLTFAIVGGGPTGVELAGAIAEMSAFTLAKDFRSISARSARVVLLEAGPRILPMFSEGPGCAGRERSGSARRRGEKWGRRLRISTRSACSSLLAIARRHGVMGGRRQGVVPCSGGGE